MDIDTYGACSGNPGPGGPGAVLYYGGHEKDLHGGDPGPTTNNRMELMVAIQVLESPTRRVRVSACTPTAPTSRNGRQQAAAPVGAGRWKTADKKPVKNADLWQRLDDRDGSITTSNGSGLRGTPGTPGTNVPTRSPTAAWPRPFRVRAADGATKPYSASGRADAASAGTDPCSGLIWPSGTWGWGVGALNNLRSDGVRRSAQVRYGAPALPDNRERGDAAVDPVVALTAVRSAGPRRRAGQTPDKVPIATSSSIRPMPRPGRSAGPGRAPDEAGRTSDRCRRRWAAGSSADPGRPPPGWP